MAISLTMGLNVQNTIDECQRLSREHDCVAVGYSGGKDSLVVLDIALRFFKKVRAFYFYFVPGLPSDIERARYCQERFGLQLLMYPDYNAIDALMNEVYCDPMPALDKVTPLTLRHMYDQVKADTGATLVLNGQKKADGPFRRRMIANTKTTFPDVYRPIQDWIRWEVLNYMKARGLVVPAKLTGKDNSAISLRLDNVLFMHDNYPQDFQVLAEYFPYIEAMIYRREWFGRTDGY